MNEIISRRLVDGAYRLALRIPSGALKGAGTAMTAAMAEEGRLVVREGPRAGSSVPWRFDAIVQDEEGALLLGPDPAGTSLSGAGLDDAAGLEEGMPRLLALARALSLLLAEGVLPRGIVSTGVLFPGGDRVLLLPPSSVARALAARGSEIRAAAAARLRSPRAAGPEADASFLLAQAAYRFATGAGAFEREAAEPGSVAGASRRSAPTGLAAPRLDPALASLIDKALADPGSARLSDWVAALDAARAAHWTRELPPGEEAAIARRGEALEASMRARQRRSDFFRKRGAILLVAAAVLAALGLVAGDLVRAQEDKPDYSWLSPRELVQRYYIALDGLDAESLEACGDKKAFKGDWNFVLNLTVITKTRTAYEGKSPLLRALDWAAAGKPALSQGELLYGISGLAISAAASSATAPSATAPSAADRETFRAEYSFWSLEPPASAPADAAPVPTEERRADTLTLERAKTGWKIVALERKVIP
jgi:hypothetical protein